MLPGPPTIAEFVPGYEASTWQGIVAPRNTPEEIVERLNKEINISLADANMKARLAEMGAAPFPGSPNEFDKFIREEIEK